MTWKTFKEQVEALGMQDTDDIWYIDVSSDLLASELKIEERIGVGKSIEN